jgi:hypothetical protein
MNPVAKKATPAAIAVLRQATSLKPKRVKASDGLLPSQAHIKQNPNSDHNTGYAVDLTHDPANGIDCQEIYKNLQGDSRVKYLIFKGKIWSTKKGELKYDGVNQHNKHLHISINETSGNDTSPWFPWLGKPSTINKVKAKLPVPLPEKKENK